MHRLLRGSLAGAVALVLASVPAAAQHFRFTPEAGQAVRALWEASVEAGEERVACLGARVHGDSVLVDRILALPPEAADSMGVSAQASIDACGPPEWSGTVHTHIAPYSDEGPSRRFSGQDRVAMSLWYDRWRAKGVFCVVYSERDAHCEADGVVGGPRSRPRQVR